MNAHFQKVLFNDLFCHITDLKQLEKLVPFYKSFTVSSVAILATWAHRIVNNPVAFPNAAAIC